MRSRTDGEARTTRSASPAPRFATFILHATGLPFTDAFSPPEGTAMKQAVTVGLAVVAGAALLEVALVPGILIGGAAVLAPRYLPKLIRRRQTSVKSSTKSSTHRQSPPQAAQRTQSNPLPAILPRLGIGTGGRQDHHLPHHCHDARLHDQLRRNRRIRDRSRPLHFQPGRRAPVLSRA